MKLALYLAACFAGGIGVSYALPGVTTRWEAANKTLFTAQYCVKIKEPAEEPASRGPSISSMIYASPPCERYESVQFGLRSDGVVVWRFIK